MTLTSLISMSVMFLLLERSVQSLPTSTGYGPYLDGSVGPNKATALVPTAEAMCKGALSLQTTVEICASLKFPQTSFY